MVREGTNADVPALVALAGGESDLGEGEREGDGEGEGDAD